MKIENALVTDVLLSTEDYNMLTAYIYVDYGGSVQGFGGNCLYKLDTGEAGVVVSAGHFITRCMEVVGVTRWEHIAGKYIRVARENGLIKGIGHILEDKWYFPADELLDK